MFRYDVVTFLTLATIISHSVGRDLRPSDHGLAYQEHSSLPTQNGDAEEMLKFFGSTTPSVPRPEVESISNDTLWSDQSDDRSRDIRRDHVRVALVVAAAVCGAAGVVLMAVTGFVFVVRLRKQKAEAERLSSNPGNVK